MPRRSRIAAKGSTSQIAAAKAPSSSRSKVLDSVASLGPLPDGDGNRRRFRLLPLSDDSDSDSTGEEDDQDPYRFFKFLPSSMGTLCSLFLVLSLFCLWSCTGHPMLLVTSISLLVSSLLSVLILSRSTTYEFMRVSYMLLLAIFTHANSPFSRMVVLYLSTLCNATLLGYTLAELRICTGSDTSIDDVSKSRKNKPARPVVSLSTLSFVCAGRVFWIACTYGAADAAAAVAEFSIMASVCMFLWAGLIHVCLLHSCFLSGDCLITYFLSGMMIFCTLTGILGTLFGDIGFVILTWLVAMGIAVFMGYTVAIYHRYKGRMQIRSTTP